MGAPGLTPGWAGMGLAARGGRPKTAPFPSVAPPERRVRAFAINTRRKNAPPFAAEGRRKAARHAGATIGKGAACQPKGGPLFVARRSDCLFCGRLPRRGRAPTDLYATATRCEQDSHARG